MQVAALDQELTKFCSRQVEAPLLATSSRWARWLESRWLPRAVIATGICLTLAVAGWLSLTLRGPVDTGYYSTGIGEHRFVPLADGSAVELNTESRIQFRFTGAAREVRLLSGEALFSVARDPARPFRVHADDATIQAIGTQFSVDKHRERVIVAVLEGKVKVALAGEWPQPALAAPAPLGVGDLAVIERNASGIANLHVTVLPRETLERRFAWTSGMLVFDGERLADVIAEMNRYNRQKIEIADSSIADIQVAGNFKTTSLPAFVRGLNAIADIEAKWPGPGHAESEPVLLYRPADAPVRQVRP